jgi:hypothetical protein
VNVDLVRLTQGNELLAQKADLAPGSIFDPELFAEDGERPPVDLVDSVARFVLDPKVVSEAQ